MVQAERRPGQLNFCWRIEMVRELRDLPTPPRLPEPYRITAFESPHIEQLSEIDLRSYQGSVDARAFSEHLGSLDGCLSMWCDVFDGRMGKFDPELSSLLWAGDRLCGFAQVARSRQSMAYLTDLAVLPEHRGGTGCALLLHALHQARRAKRTAMGLTVTAGNECAIGLYEKLGFTEVGWSIRIYREPAPGPS
jgi:ribosomal protein S18 acetylase RimI-like enzyme